MENILKLNKNDKKFKEYYNNLQMIKMVYDLDVNNDILTDLIEIKNKFESFDNIRCWLIKLFDLQKKNISYYDSFRTIYYKSGDNYNNTFEAENLFIMVAHKIVILTKMFEDNNKMIEFLSTKVKKEEICLIKFVIENTSEYNQYIF
ncbi:hypothetical protein Catovirus_1_523 [Catovirus CTV1]|uniref:Uncharacterized protein n=1 Tax=Catovirus CTV1 TaxID=1977631 RepID=A0A1V0S9U9_9VIRU|nr:hypothetical protein Catovirus_1_523 [Catovirus CTV1]